MTRFMNTRWRITESTDDKIQKQHIDKSQNQQIYNYKIGIQIISELVEDGLQTGSSNGEIKKQQIANYRFNRQRNTTKSSKNKQNYLISSPKTS